MGGRNAKPVQLHIAQGNPNRLTKAEIARRKAKQVQLGEQKLRCPAFVKNDVVAFAKWKEISKIYKDVEFVTSGDAGLLGRYCMAFSEYHDLLGHRRKIGNFDGFNYDDDDLVREKIEDQYGERQAAKLFAKIEYILSVPGILAIDQAVNRKMDALKTMEDRLFLNPLSKVKNVPKKEPEKEDPLGKKGFGNI
jgi:phage terminase small subunit